MNIENIEAFVFVAHFGSFNKAAKALYLTQPSVSARIQTLERELNIQLFNRNGKKVALTEKGKHFIPFAQKILQSYQEAKVSLYPKRLDLKELSIACSLSISTYIVPELLQLFHQHFPDVTIKIVTGHSDDVLQKVINKDVDFGIARTVSHPKIENIHFHTDPINLVVPQNHPLLDQKGVITIEALSKEPFIFFDHGSIDWLMVYGLFRTYNLKPNVAFEVDSMEVAKKMVMKGLGISFLPDLCIQKELQTGELVKVYLPDFTQIARKIDLLYLQGAQPSPFLNFFTQSIDY